MYQCQVDLLHFNLVIKFLYYCISVGGFSMKSNDFYRKHMQYTSNSNDLCTAGFAPGSHSFSSICFELAGWLNKRNYINNFEEF